MIRARMAATRTPARRPSPATIALVLAALVAAAAVAYALFFRRRQRRRRGAPAAAANAAAPAPGSQRRRDDRRPIRAAAPRTPTITRAGAMLGMAYRGCERFAEAGQAFRRAMELRRATPITPPIWRDDLMEPRRRHTAARGRAPVPPRARASARQSAGALSISPRSGTARRPSRRGRRPHRPAARGAGRRGLAAAGARAVTAIAGANNIDIAGRLPAAPAAAAPAIDSHRRHPRPDGRAIARGRRRSLPSEQDAAGRAMVDRLAARLCAGIRATRCAGSC